MKKRKAGRPHRSIRKWLEQLPEPYRTQAIANTPVSTLDREPHRSSRTLSGALFSAFVFHKTREGGDYWNELYQTLLK